MKKLITILIMISQFSSSIGQITELRKTNESSNRIENLMKNKSHFIIISPHLDDGVWSCAGLMYKATQNDCRVDMITVHTGNSKEEKLPKLQRKEVTKKGSLELRKKEDEAAAKILNINVYWWDYPTRLLRKPWLKNRRDVFNTPIYDSIAKDPQYTDIKQQIKQLIDKYPEAILLCPMGVGNMYDHVELFAACINVGLNKNHLHQMFFYEDSYAILTGPRTEHFLLKEYVWDKKNAPEITSLWWRMMGRVMSKSSSKSDIRTCIPHTLLNAKWKYNLINIEKDFDIKMKSLAKYDSQMSQFGGMKRVRKVFNKYHEFWNNSEPYWYLGK